MTYTGYDGPDEICKAMLTALHGVTTQYSELAGKLAAADGDREKAVQSFIEGSDDPQAVKLRATMEKALAQLKDLAEKKVVSVTLSDTEKEKIKTELEGLKGRIRSGHQAVTSTADSLGNDPENVKAALAALGDPTRSGRGRKAGSAGSGLPRASVMVTVNGGNLKDQVYDSFSKVAMVFNCEVKDLQEAYASAAGVDSRDIKTVKKPVRFSFQPNSNGATYELTTKPKERQKPGPKPKGEESTESKQETEPAKTEAA